MSRFLLDTLDDALATGIAQFGDSFRTDHARFVTWRQQADGGFAGRQGGSDLYYTDFAVRTLRLVAGGGRAIAAARSYLASLAPRPSNVIECFNLLNLRRMLPEEPPRGEDDRPRTPPLRRSLRDLGPVLRRQMLPGGGFASAGGSDRLSVYQTFLGLLCFGMLGKRPRLPRVLRTLLAHLVGRRFFPDLAAAQAIAALQSADGGYCESPGQTQGQTSATAAAIAVLLGCGRLGPDQAKGAVAFLAARQGPDGGLAAHPGIQAGDLLSTFTGLVASWMMRDRTLSLGAIGRFVRTCARSDGGFGAMAADPEADVEYTYYGVASAALLRHLAGPAPRPA